MWTPHDIEVLLHHHCSVGPWPLGATSAYEGSCRKLCDLGLLERKDGEIVSTEKGAALIELWCAQPVPTVRYVDPRFAGTLNDPTLGLAL